MNGESYESSNVNNTKRQTWGQTKRINYREKKKREKKKSKEL
jgi:hypothetical protein